MALKSAVLKTIFNEILVALSETYTDLVRINDLNYSTPWIQNKLICYQIRMFRILSWKITLGRFRLEPKAIYNSSGMNELKCFKNRKIFSVINISGIFFKKKCKLTK
jgi:hypothetical protein